MRLNESDFEELRLPAQGEQSFSGGRHHLGKASGLVRDPSQGTLMHVRAIYAFMNANQATCIFTIAAMGRVFKVWRRAFDDWRRRTRQRDVIAEAKECALKQLLRSLEPCSTVRMA